VQAPARTLALHFCANAAVLDVEDERPVRGVAKVPVPAVLPRGLFGRAGRAGRGRYTLDDGKELVEEHTLGLIDGLGYLALDTVPDSVDGVLGHLQLLPERVEVGADGELVVRAPVTEVEPGGDGQVRLDGERELCGEALAAGARMRHE
jgi:hypothetical protein